MVSGQAGAARASEKRFAPELVPGRSVSAEHLAQLRTLPGAEMIPSCAPDLRRASERASEREIPTQGIATICKLAVTPGALCSEHHASCAGRGKVSCAGRLKCPTTAAWAQTISTTVAFALELARGGGGTPLISRKLVCSAWAPRVCTSFPGLTCSALLRNPCQGPRQLAPGNKFAKVLSVATFYSKYTRVLSSENMSTGILAPGRKSARPRKRRPRATR